MQDPAGERRLALVCHTWGHPSTFYSWIFMKQYLLRRVVKGDQMVLDPQEKLFILKAGKDKGDDAFPDRWKLGGPLVPDLDTALHHYPHTVTRLEGSVKSNLRTCVLEHDVDILVVPDHWPQAAIPLPGFTTVSDWVKNNVPCPFIIIRRSAVVNARLKFSSRQTTGAAVGPSVTAPGGIAPIDSLRRTSVSAAAAQTGRRIAIAYNSFAVGRGLMAFAKDKVLTHNDTIYIVHAFPSQQNPVVKETIKFMRVMTMQRAESPVGDEVTRDNSIQFGAAELEGYNLQLNCTLQGDPKNSISSFCDSEEIELLIVGTRSGFKIRKKLSGGGVSSHLIDSAPCPVLVVPYKFMGVEEGGTADEELVGSPGSPPGLGPWGASWPAAVPASAAGGTEVAAQPEGGAQHSSPSDLLAVLQKEIEYKDREIADLRRQVHELQLAAAQRNAAAAHDGVRPDVAM